MRTLRIYHPDYIVGWYDRLYDGFSAHKPAPRELGVDYTLLNRSVLRSLRELLEGVHGIHTLGEDMVRIDTTWSLPQSSDGRLSLVEGLVLRLRLSQLHPGDRRVSLSVRWFEFADGPIGTRILVRMVFRPVPTLPVVLAGNLSEDDGTWNEFAVGLD